MKTKGIMAVLAATGVAMCAQGADIKIDFNAEMGKGATWVATDGTLSLAFAAEKGDVDPRAAQLANVRDTWRPSFEVGETTPAVRASHGNVNEGK